MTIQKINDVLTNILLLVLMMMIAAVIYLVIMTTPRQTRLDKLEQKVDSLEQAVYE